MKYTQSSKTSEKLFFDFLFRCLTKDANRIVKKILSDKKDEKLIRK